MNEIAKTQVDPLRQVVEWIIAGHSQPEIQDAVKQYWPSEKSRPLIGAAIKHIAKSGDPDRTS